MQSLKCGNLYFLLNLFLYRSVMFKSLLLLSVNNKLFGKFFKTHKKCWLENFLSVKRFRKSHHEWVLYNLFDPPKIFLPCLNSPSPKLAFQSVHIPGFIQWRSEIHLGLWYICQETNQEIQDLRALISY